MSVPMTYERPTLADTLEEIGVRKVRVAATVFLDAYILADHEDGPKDIRQKIAWEIADAVEYRAPHLTDTEPGDALICADGPAKVEIDYVYDEGPADAAWVAERADGYAGEVFG